MTKTEIYEKGRTFDEEIAQNREETLRNYKRATHFFFASTLALAFVVVALFPLKSIETVLITVNKLTGQTQVVHNLDDNLDKSTLESVKINLLTQYVIWYKTYDEADATKRAEKMKIFSSNDVYNDFKHQFRRDDKKNPNNYYLEGEKATVYITSVTPLNKSTYQIRFELEEDLRNKQDLNVRHFLATIKFTLTKKGLKQTDSWRNPIGLVIDSIRFDEDYKNQ